MDKVFHVRCYGSFNGEDALDELDFLYSSVIESIKRKENILPMLERSLKKIKDSIIGRDSEEDFGGLINWKSQSVTSNFPPTR